MQQQQQQQMRHLGRPRVSTSLPVTSLGLLDGDHQPLVLPQPQPQPQLQPQAQAHWRYFSVLGNGRTELRAGLHHQQHKQQHPHLQQQQQYHAAAPAAQHPHHHHSHHHHRRRSSRSRAHTAAAKKQQQQQQHQSFQPGFPISSTDSLAAERPLSTPPPPQQQPPAMQAVPGIDDETEARLLQIRQKLCQLSLQQEQEELLQQQRQWRQQQQRRSGGSRQLQPQPSVPVRARLVPALRPPLAPQRPARIGQPSAPSDDASSATPELEGVGEGGETEEVDDADDISMEDETATTVEGDADVMDCLDDDTMSGCGSLGNTGGAGSSVLASRRPSAGPTGGPRQPATIASLFPHVPPVLRFAAEGDPPPEALPWELRRQLRWRMSSITPVVVKRAVARSGFRVAKKSHEWLGYFGKHMKPEGFRGIREYQKMNHFPGSFSIGRKDRLWRSLHRMQCHHGRREFNFFPLTFCLPGDLKLLRRAWEDSSPKQKWIVKPPASARGIGVRVVNKWQQVPKRRSVVVQTYLSKPYLINGSKFDLRVYVYVTSFDPLRIYVHERGLVRFASVPYNQSSKCIGNRFMHLTNYSVNKRNADYTSGDAERDGEGHKWTLRALWAHLRQAGHDPESVWSSVKDLVVKTIASGEAHINSQVKAFCRRRYCVHELFGFDILLDEQLKPWLLEVNISPSLHSNSQLDIEVKSAMIRDMMNLAGFQLPEPAASASSPASASSSATATNGDVNSVTTAAPFADRRCWPERPMSPDERAKKLWFSQQRFEDLGAAAAAAILEPLTPDDLRVLVESLDEFARAGEFSRVFPVADEEAGYRYLGFLEQPRYYNVLLLHYLLRYRGCEPQGLEALAALCRRRLHFEASTADPAHQWSPPRRFRLA